MKTKIHSAKEEGSYMYLSDEKKLKVLKKCADEATEAQREIIKKANEMNKLDEILTHLQAMSVVRAMEVYESPESKFFEMDMLKLIKEAKQAIINWVSEEIMGVEEDYICYVPFPSSANKIKSFEEYTKLVLLDMKEKLQKLKEL